MKFAEIFSRVSLYFYLIKVVPDNVFFRMNFISDEVLLQDFGQNLLILDEKLALFDEFLECGTSSTKI